MEGWSQKGSMHIMWLLTEMKVPECKPAFLKVSTPSCVSQTFDFNIPQLCICFCSGTPRSWESWAEWDPPHLQPRDCTQGSFPSDIHAAEDWHGRLAGGIQTEWDGDLAFLLRFGRDRCLLYTSSWLGHYPSLSGLSIHSDSNPHLPQASS